MSDFSKGFPFYGVTLTYADFFNLAQLASWAEFKNVQNLHQSNVTPWKKKPFSTLQCTVTPNRVEQRTRKEIFWWKQGYPGKKFKLKTCTFKIDLNPFYGPSKKGFKICTNINHSQRSKNKTKIIFSLIGCAMNCKFNRYMSI